MDLSCRLEKEPRSVIKFKDMQQLLHDRDCRRHFASCGVAVQGEMNVIVQQKVAAGGARQVMQSITDAAEC